MLTVDRLVFREKALIKDRASKFKSFRQNSPKGQQKKKKMFLVSWFEFSVDLSQRTREQLGEKNPPFYKSPAPLSALMVSYTRTIVLLAGY